MDEFFGRYRNLSVLLAVVFAQIILLGYQVRTERGSRLLREWTVRSITPVTKSVRGLTQWAGSDLGKLLLAGRHQTGQRDPAPPACGSQAQNTGLRSNLARFKREEKLVDYQDDLPSKTTLAQVIGKGRQLQLPRDLHQPRHRFRGHRRHARDHPRRHCRQGAGFLSGGGPGDADQRSGGGRRRAAGTQPRRRDPQRNRPRPMPHRLRQPRGRR